VTPRILPFEARFLRDCEALIAALPGWFGIPESNARFLRDLPAKPSWVALLGTLLVGAVTMERHSPCSFEISFLAVRPEHHRRGIGRALVRHVEAEARAEGGRFLHVKTLGPSHPDPGYARTRAFYEALGFHPLFESATVWGAGNPALISVKTI